MLKQITGKVPEYCDLIWIETKEGPKEVEDFWRTNEKELNLTGKMVTFRREFDEREKYNARTTSNLSDSYWD